MVKSKELFEITLVGVVVILLAAMISIAGCTISIETPYGDIETVQVTTQTPTPFPTVTPTPTPIYKPSTIMFTVLKANAASPNSGNQLDRYYSVLTTDGDILVFTDFYRWDEMIPQQTYNCNIVNSLSGYGRTVYSVTNCEIYKYSYRAQVLEPTTFYRYNYTHYYDPHTGRYYLRDWNDDLTYSYYHYYNQYWECFNGYYCDTITLSQIPAYVTIYESPPPIYN